MAMQKTETNLTIEDIKKLADSIANGGRSAYSIVKMESVRPKPPGWVTRLMARFGWHRKYELIIIDKAALRHSLFSRPEL